MKNLIVALLLLTSVIAKAQEGHDQGGGGDPCEDRIQEIRNDIKLWISAGGSKDLKLPNGISVDQYNQEMFKAIDSTKVVCVKPGDSGYPIAVNGTPKVCKFEKSWRKNKITCDYNAFLNKSTMDESMQYQIIHHEYAGIAGLENPDGDVSKYLISNQISAYLVDKVVKRLAVKSVPNNNDLNGWIRLNGTEGADLARSLQDVVANTKFKDCDVTVYERDPLKLTCGGGVYSDNVFSFTSTLGEKMSFYNVMVGRFLCDGDMYDEEWKSKGGNLQLLKSSDGKPNFLNVYVNSAKYRGKVLTKFELNSEGTKLKKVNFQMYITVNTNIGTVGNPNWADKDILDKTLTCNAAND